MNYSQRDNIIMTTLPQYSNRMIVNESQMDEAGNYWIHKLGVKTKNITNPVKALSGGNQQKVVLGKWFAMNPKILILDGPTVGVDVGAKAGIFKTIWEMVDELGMSVILISDEIREIVTNCQRVLVMHNGHIIKELDKPEEITEVHIQNLMDSQKKSTTKDIRERGTR